MLSQNSTKPVVLRGVRYLKRHCDPIENAPFQRTELYLLQIGEANSETAHI